MDALNQAGALVMIALGGMGLFFPETAARFVSVAPVGKLGKSELRATYGGFFLALGLGCIVLGSPEVYRVIGIAWLGAAIGRTISIAVDRSVSYKNFGGVFFEAAIGGALSV
ncbi:MAG: hypothetical protein A3I66_04465 [Burkholderiales bacterium RIFCSPLOWO2_02_FULL_57_36]|nr:MAG: hypothetical protein A3I66_04465 [Burkholderiales bacterium RIFCSPLOWO2_02_FULL_57_36]